MAYDESLGSRVRTLLNGAPGVVEKKMFGGLAFLTHGNMSVGIHGSDLIVRLDPSEAERALREPGTGVFDLTGRPLKGWLMVSGEAVQQPVALEGWVKRGVAYASSLPPK